MKPLKFIEHPEGGRFCEVYRSGTQVRNRYGDRRCALTHIYFSLKPDEISHFHRVGSDEVWNLYQGKGLVLYLLAATGEATTPSLTRVVLSSDHREFCHVVPAGVWQAAVPLQDTVLVGCSVSPGFEFSDFQLLNIKDKDAQHLCAQHPELSKLIIA